MEGNKELKEALIAAFAVASEIAKVAQDGLQLSDVTALAMKFQEPALAAKLAAAQEGAEKIPAEAKDLSAIEVLDLLVAVAPEVLKFAEAMKKPEAAPVA